MEAATTRGAQVMHPRWGGEKSFTLLDLYNNPCNIATLVIRTQHISDLVPPWTKPLLAPSYQSRKLTNNLSFGVVGSLMEKDVNLRVVAHF